MEVETQTGSGYFGSPWMCVAQDRLDPFEEHDELHEIRHGEKWLETLAPLRNALGSSHSSLAACQAQLTQQRNNFDQALDARNQVELAHGSHINWPRHLQLCVGPTVVSPYYTTPYQTTEVFCPDSWQGDGSVSGGPLEPHLNQIPGINPGSSCPGPGDFY